MIWKEQLSVEQLNYQMRQTIHEALGICFIQIGKDFLEAKMPVDDRTRQPLGLLHGGASAVLAESLGSRASALVVGPEAIGVGIELNVSHLKSMRHDWVYGRTTPIRLGKNLHIWEIRIRSDISLEAPLVCLGRLTVLIKSRTT